MKLALFGISEINVGKHNLKDPRLDQADKLAEADKKTHAQVDVLGQDQLLDADAIVASLASKADLILRDWSLSRLGWVAIRSRLSGPRSRNSKLYWKTSSSFSTPG